MKTKTILQTLALAMLMPTMLLTTACSNDDEIVNTENPANTKGYALPVTINVTRQGDATTRATYDGETKKLSFSTGDKLFVKGSYNEGECTYAGMLDYVSDGTFSGTIMTQTEWTGTIEELLSEDGGANATLLPAGYGEYGYLSIMDGGTYDAYLDENSNKAFATSKATAVEQFSWEYDNNYSSGFELIPTNAILNFTINGLDASTEVDVSFSYPHYPDPIVISGKVTTDGDGTATFAIGIIYGNNLKDCTLTVGGNAITLVSSSKYVEAGKIYNINRSAAPAGPTYPAALSAVTSAYIGSVVTTDGNVYATASDATAAGKTAVAMIAYVNGSNGLAIQLNSSPESKDWEGAKTYAEGLNTSTPIAGGTWRLPSKEDWQNMFLGCAVSGDARTSDSMKPIAGFKAKIAATGITWHSDYYWSSTASGSKAWDVRVYLGGSSAYANFVEDVTYYPHDVLGCLAF